jgi:hypothetical protein
MVTKPKNVEPVSEDTRVPPPVAGGTGYHESLGRWVDDLFGDRRQREAAAHRLESMLSDEIPDDPPPSEAPAPVPGGTEPVTRGDKPTETI